MKGLISHLTIKTPSEVHFNLERKSIDSNFEFLYTEKELKYIENW